MGSKIQLLDDQTINQIAAGEVIENPASVVKELVENAIDAGSKKIFVEIIAGGQEYICVQDNGFGMTQEDALLSLCRHATSKIRTADDLFSLVTMGFRGEALASIAAISEFSLSTACKGESAVQEGTHLVVKGGAVSSCSTTSCLPGTRIEVRSLFYNVPARKKFQKSPARDTVEVVKLLTHIALAHPEVEFELIANHKKEFHLKPATFENLKERIQFLLSHEYAAEMKLIECEVEGIKIQGFVGSPSACRPNRTGQYLFINRRPITSLSLSYAVKDGYGTSLESPRHPTFVLHLFLPPDSVDVNVHPQKKEVRFRQEDLIKKAVSEAVERALFQNEKAPVEMKVAEAINKSVPIEPFLPSGMYKKSFQSSYNFSPQQKNYHAFEQAPFDAPSPIAIVAKNKDSSLSPLLPLPPPDMLQKEVSTFHIVGTFQEYILLEVQWSQELTNRLPDKLKGAGLCIAECRSVLSRIAYEDLTDLDKQKKDIASQQLLMPIFVELSQSEASILMKMMPLLLSLGFEIREFGRAAFLIESIPATFDPVHVVDFIRELVQEEEGAVDPAKTKRYIAKAAAAASSRGKYPMSRELAREIIKRLLDCQDPFRGPFGEAVFVLLTKSEIQEKFL